MRYLLIALVVVALAGCLNVYRGRYLVIEVKSTGTPWAATATVGDAVRSRSVTMASPPYNRIAEAPAFPGLEYTVRVTRALGRTCVTIYLSPASTVQGPVCRSAPFTVSGKLATGSG